MKDCKVNVLGTEYSIQFRGSDQDELLTELDGYCDKTTKEIIVSKKDPGCNLKQFEVYQKKVTRHEIIHAFMFESGLAENFEHRSLGQEETTVDWIAIQFPKMLEAFKQADCL